MVSDLIYLCLNRHLIPFRLSASTDINSRWFQDSVIGDLNLQADHPGFDKILDGNKSLLTMHYYSAETIQGISSQMNRLCYNPIRLEGFAQISSSTMTPYNEILQIVRL